jgi:glutamine synthetase adenylyltransferase
LRYCEFETGTKTATIEELMQMRLNLNDDQRAATVLTDIDVSRTLLVQPHLQRLIAAQREKELIDAQSQIVWCGHALNLSTPDKVAALHRALRQFDAELAQAISFDDKVR